MDRQSQSLGAQLLTRVTASAAQWRVPQNAPFLRKTLTKLAENAVQNLPFGSLKRAVSQSKTTRFRMRNGTFWKPAGLNPRFRMPRNACLPLSR